MKVKPECNCWKMFKMMQELVRILDDRTRPENCYVNAWHVHEDWEKLKKDLRIGTGGPNGK